jgi:hypothetical protein
MKEKNKQILWGDGSFRRPPLSMVAKFWLAVYLISSTAALALFFHASQIGWKIVDPDGVSQKKTQGVGQYHK